MNKVTFHLLILIFFLAPSISSFNITCRFSDVLASSFRTTRNLYISHFNPKIKPYQCEVAELTVLEPIQFVSNISGQHAINNSHLDVNYMRISSHVCHYIPIGLTKFFYNLEVLRIEKSRLRSIQKYDFYGFRNLSVLLLNDNNLMTLDIGLFEFMPNLKHVDFSNNLIFHVDPMIFSDSENMRTVEILENPCSLGLNSFATLPSDRNYLHSNLIARCSRTLYIQYLKDNRGFEINSVYRPSEIDRIKGHFQNEMLNFV